MGVDAIVLAINWLRNIVLCIGLFFAAACVERLFMGGFKSSILHIKKPLFAWVTLAFSFLALGFFTGEPLSFLHKGFLSMVSTVFFTAAYLMFIIAFSFFWHHSSKLQRLHHKELFFFSAAISAVLIWLLFLFKTTLVPRLMIFPMFTRISLFLHPLAVSLMFLLTLRIHPAVKAKVMRTPILYISSGAFLYFLGFMVLIHANFNQHLRFIPVLYSALFFLSAIYFLIGFVVADKKYR
ncbi:MAG: hypothetical protein V1866_04350 [archaeon]